MEKLRGFINRNYLILLFSLVFGISMTQMAYMRDDVLFEYTPKTISGYIDLLINNYNTWSSRVLISAVQWPFKKLGVIGDLLRGTLLTYIFISAFSYLCTDDNDTSKRNIAILFSMLLPFEVLSTAGWRATIGVYYTATAFGLWSVIPLKKILQNKKIDRLELIGYCFVVAVAANHELMCGLLIILYMATITYLFLKRRFSIKVIVLLGVLFCDLAFILLSPGNQNRNQKEISNYLQIFDMFGIVDKADMGVSNALYWMMNRGRIAFLFLAFVLGIIIWKQYSDNLYRALSLIPLVVMLGLGPLNDIICNVFQGFSTHFIVSDYGFFNVASDGRGIGMLSFVLYSAVIVCTVIELFLLRDNIDGFIFDIALCVAGFASDAVMGFSPTVYASSDRVHLFFTLFFMVAATRSVVRNLNTIDELTRRRIYWIAAIMVTLNITNFVFYVEMMGRSV